MEQRSNMPSQLQTTYIESVSLSQLKSTGPQADKK